MALNVSGKLGSSRRDDEPTPQIFICARHVADLAAAGDIPMKCEWLNSDVTGSRVCVCTSYDVIRCRPFQNNNVNPRNQEPNDVCNSSFLYCRCRVRVSTVQ